MKNPQNGWWFNNGKPLSFNGEDLGGKCTTIWGKHPQIISIGSGSSFRLAMAAPKKAYRKPTDDQRWQHDMRETPGGKGLPAALASYHLYENCSFPVGGFLGSFPQVDVKKQKIFATTSQILYFWLHSLIFCSMFHMWALFTISKSSWDFSPVKSMRKKNLQSLRRFAGEKSFPNKLPPFLIGISSSGW